MKKLQPIKLRQKKEFQRDNLKSFMPEQRQKKENLNYNKHQTIMFQEYFKFFKWYVGAGGVIPQSKDEFLIEKFRDYGDFL